MNRLGPNMKHGPLLMVFVFILSSLALYGGAKLVEEERPAAANGAVDNGDVTPGGPVEVTIVAKNILFDKRSIAASPGVEVTVTFDNQDAGVLHNIDFYTDQSAAERLFTNPPKMEIFPGLGQRELKFTAPTIPGTYFFKCDVHPGTMTGGFSVVQ